MINAFTAQESTSFWFKLPSEHVFAGLDILYDILSNPVFPAEKFEKEKKVILEEIKIFLKVLGKKLAFLREIKTGLIILMLIFLIETTLIQVGFMMRGISPGKKILHQ